MKILLPTDGSKHSDGAARFLKNLEFTSGDEITILHVVSEVPFKIDRKAYYSILKHILKPVRLEVSPEIIKRTIDILEPVDAKKRELVKTGYPDKIINNIAKRYHADIIVMGARGLSGMKALLIGGVTRSVAINCSTPVLVVKTPQWNVHGKLKILFATDGSDSANETARFLSSIPFGTNTEMTIVHVIPSFYDIAERTHIEVLASVKKYVAEMKTVAYRESEKIINKTYELLGNRYIKTRDLIREGDPKLEILNTEKELHADIIVVGSKGLRGIKGMLGSVARYVLSHAECSVLIGKAK